MVFNTHGMHLLSSYLISGMTCKDVVEEALCFFPFLFFLNYYKQKNLIQKMNQRSTRRQ